MGKLIDVIKMVADPTENQINMQNCMLSNYNTKLLLTVYFNKYIFYSTFHVELLPLIDIRPLSKLIHSSRT